MPSRWPLAFAVVVAGCSARGASSPAGPRPVIDYVVSPPARGSWLVHVEATIARAPTEHVAAPEAEGYVTAVSRVTASGPVPLARDGDGWLAPGCRTRCTLRYDVDVGELASSCRGMDCERRVGDAVIGSAATWMLRPQPSGDALIRVELRGPHVDRMATGLRPAPGGGYAIRAWQLGEAPYTAIGDFRRVHVEAGLTPLDVVLLGRPLAMGDDGVRQWVTQAAGCVASLFGRFPVASTIFVVPVDGADEVVFGRVMSLAGASAALLVGRETRLAQFRNDWVSVHELFHLGTPSFVGEGHWLEEGLATYYEPILRERAGWMTEAELWAHFAKEMPRGLRRAEDAPSLEDRDDIDSTYWGGALFAFLADVRIREATHGARSLDTVLRAALDRLGDATHAASVADFLRVGDEATGTHVLADLYESDAVRGEPVDLDAIWRSLGIAAGAGGSVKLDDAAPEAHVRAGIASDKLK